MALWKAVSRPVPVGLTEGDKRKRPFFGEA